MTSYRLLTVAHTIALEDQYSINNVAVLRSGNSYITGNKPWLWTLSLNDGERTGQYNGPSS
jgi:hypothetical protein